MTKDKLSHPDSYEVELNMRLSTGYPLIKEFISYKRINEGRAASTCRNYSMALHGFANYLAGINKDFSNVSTVEIEDYVGLNLHAAGRKVSSRRVAIYAIKGFYAWLNKRYGYNNPANAIQRPFSGLKLPKAVTLNQAERILAMPDLATFTGIRDMIILMIMIGMGMRRGEVVGLNQEDLLFDANQRLLVTVTGKGGKQRILPAPSEVALLLRAYLNHPELLNVDRFTITGARVLLISTGRHDIQPFDYIGENRRLHPARINQILYKYARLAGIDVKAIHPHGFRHLFGQEMMENGVDSLIIQSLMGHSNLNTTTLYAQISSRLKLKAIQAANPLTKICNPISEFVKQMNKK